MTDKREKELRLTPDEISVAFRGHGLHASMAVKEGITRDIIAKVKAHYELLIEEAKKQERKRIFREIEGKHKMGNAKWISGEDWQSLKEGGH